VPPERAGTQPAPKLKELCDELRHAYAYVEADDVHASVQAVLKLMPGFTAAYLRWLAEYDVKVG